MPSSEAQRLRNRLGAHRLHASRDSREITSAARKVFLDRFEREVDPEGTLPEAERARRAKHARKAYFTGLALKSVKARAARKKPRKPDPEEAEA